MYKNKEISRMLFEDLLKSYACKPMTEEEKNAWLNKKGADDENLSR